MWDDKMRKFYENEVTFLLRKIIDNEIRLQINVLGKVTCDNLTRFLCTANTNLLQIIFIIL